MSDYSQIERGALLTITLSARVAVTCSDVARRFKINRTTAWRDLVALSRVLPIVNENGAWQWRISG